MALVDAHIQDYYRSRADGPYKHKGDPYELGRATELVRRYGDTIADEGVRACLEIQVAVAAKDQIGMRKHLAALCRIPNNGEALKRAGAHIRQGEFGHVAVGALEPFVLGESPDPELVALWVEFEADLPASRFYATIPKLAPGTAVPAAIAYLDYLVYHPHVPSITGFVNDNAKWLRSRTDLWYAAARALQAAREFKAAAKWMADWDSREGVSPGILVTYVDILRNLGAHEEARRISRYALMLPQDNDTILHEMWLALDAGLSRDFAPAAEVIQRVNRRMKPHYQFLFHSLCAFAAVMEKELSDHTWSLKTAQTSMEEAEQVLPDFMSDPLYKEIWSSVISRVCKKIDTAQAELWNMKTQLAALM
jgi:hypothetical protein